jgi:hypothetical protein
MNTCEGVLEIKQKGRQDNNNHTSDALNHIRSGMERKQTIAANFMDSAQKNINSVHLKQFPKEIFIFQKDSKSITTFFPES